MIDQRTKINIYALAILLLSLSFLPMVGPALMEFLAWELGGTMFTPGMIAGAIGLWASWLLWKRRI